MRDLRCLLRSPLALAVLTCGLAHAQSAVPIVMFSDIHLDPFHDPAKLPQLRAEPIDRWAAILNGPPSATQATDIQALQEGCQSKALDTDWSLLKSATAAARDAESHPLFVTVAGDLLAHQFTCRYERLTPGAKPEETAAFAAKTIAFLMAQLRAAFPRVPVYAALGNNDSGCVDYRETPGDAFLASSGAALAAAAGVDPAKLTPEGDYSVALPAPMSHARLIVLQDLFEARQFTTCAGAADRSGEMTQIAWLRSQLEAARQAHEHVWVMAHMPPSVDAYNSFRQFVLRPGDMCTAEPRGYLADTSLADALLDYADVVPLSVFGHTHMDDLRVLHRASSAPGGPGTTVPAKLVPSVTPYTGNHPSFLVASVDPRSAVLKDWHTVVSPGPDGSTPPWTVAYRFTATYHLPDFSAASALKLAKTFTADKSGQSADSAAFREHFYPGDIGLYALGLAQIWPAYACSVRNDRPSSVQRCVCGIKPLQTPSQQMPQP